MAPPAAVRAQLCRQDRICYGFSWTMETRPIITLTAVGDDGSSIVLTDDTNVMFKSGVEYNVTQNTEFEDFVWCMRYRGPSQTANVRDPQHGASARAPPPRSTNATLMHACARRPDAMQPVFAVCMLCGADAPSTSLIVCIPLHTAGQQALRQVAIGGCRRLQVSESRGALRC